MSLSFFGTGRGSASGGNQRPPGPDTTRLQQVRAYWEGLRQGADAPLRSQVDPRGIEGALDVAFVVERIAPGVARLRIAGMGLVDLMGMEVRGMPLSALFDPMARPRLALAVEQVFAHPAILDLRLEAERGIGKPALAGQMILLPLRGDTARPDMALGCLVTQGELGRSPRRFTMMQDRLTPLVEGDIVKPAPAPRPAMPFALAEAGLAFQVKPTPSAKPYLRLVDLDRR